MADARWSTASALWPFDTAFNYCDSTDRLGRSEWTAKATFARSRFSRFSLALPPAPPTPPPSPTPAPDNQDDSLVRAALNLTPCFKFGLVLGLLALPANTPIITPIRQYHVPEDFFKPTVDRDPASCERKYQDYKKRCAAAENFLVHYCYGREANYLGGSCAEKRLRWVLECQYNASGGARNAGDSG